MKRMHVAFCLEQQYGHIVPTLGIALELIRRGHRVSYAVIAAFAPLIRRIDAMTALIDPFDTRAEVLGTVLRKNDCVSYNRDEVAVQRVAELSRERTGRSLAQLESVYRDDMPDVIVHDDVFDTAGRTLAQAKGLPKIRLQSQFIDRDDPAFRPTQYDDDEMILVTVPKFFQRNHEHFAGDRRFQFVGFIPEGRALAFAPWSRRQGHARPILASATTGMLPQLEYCRTLLDAFRGRHYEVVLAISASLDRASDIDPALLGELPPNIEINRFAGNFQILEAARLFIGQGGQGATLEAIYWGVPQIVVPPTPYHNRVALRVSELGLGTCLPISEMSPARIRSEVTTLLEDREAADRAQSAGHSMRNARGAALAADLIEAHFAGHGSRS